MRFVRVSTSGLGIAALTLGVLLTATSAFAAFVQQGAKLVGTGAVGAAYQGMAVAFSADGNTAIVGGYRDDGDAGAAWIYTRNGSAWSQQGGKLVGTGAVGAAAQGASVALSADGNTAIVGAIGDDGSKGAAWVFTRSGGVWTQQGDKLVGAGAASGSNHGASVALSADGNTAIVGGHYDNGNTGAAWVYTRSGGVWSQQGDKLVGAGAVGGANQGVSVALSEDGNTALVGGPNDDGAAGATWVYTRSGGVWSQQGSKLVGTGAVHGSLGTFQGQAVALSADGNTAFVGAFRDDTNKGAAWVFIRSGGVWSQQGAKLVGTGATGAATQGISVALSADGNKAAVGGYSDNATRGATWIWTRSGGVWSQQGAKLVGTGVVGFAHQGRSVALSAGASLLLVGGYSDNMNAGAAWVFADPPSVSIDDVTIGEGDAGATTATFTVSLSSPALGGESVDYATTDGTATTADDDYVAANGTITFLAGEASRTIDVTVNGDLKHEADQTFTVTLDGPVGLTIGDGNALGTIENDDGVPVLAIDDVMQLEGDSGTQNFVFDLTLSNPSDQTVTVDFTTADGTATVADDDYAATAGTATIDPGTDGTTVTVAVQGDTKSELTEVFYVDLSNPLNATLANTQAIGMILSEDATGARFLQQGAKLVGTGVAIGANQGKSVAVSADGNTAIVGGYVDNGWAGAAWVFTRSNGVWIQQGEKLVGTGAVGNAEQGASVALSGDGNTAVVGGPFDDNRMGAVWVYTRSGGVWTQQGEKLVGAGATGDVRQGTSLAISADGSTIITGGYNDDISTGAVWVYTRSGGSWSQQGSKLVGTGAVGGADQGYSVALSADGSTAIAGGIGDSGGIGAAWVYTRSGGVWSQQGEKLVGTSAVGSSYQGGSVSLSADGNTAIVGGIGDNGFIGAAWVYTRSGGVWSEQGGKLVGTGYVGAPRQGSSVALSADGNVALVSGGVDFSNRGATWVWIRSGGVWRQDWTKLVGTGAVGSAAQGVSVALSGDGNTAIVGGPSDNSGQGAAWVYVRTMNPVAVGDLAVTEGNSGTTTASFTVSLEWPALGGEWGDYATADAFATVADGDYVAASGTITFLTGETSRAVDVTVNGDLKYELDDPFIFFFSNPVGLSIGRVSGHCWILNDDVVPSVAIDDVTLLEGDSGTRDFVFNVGLSNPTYQTVTVDFTTTDGTATAADGDYTAASGTATVDPGAGGTTATVVVHGDTNRERNEVFYVDLSNPSNAALADTQGIGTILSDDLAAAIASVADVPDDQGGCVWLTIDRSPLDDAAETATPATSYTVWRKVPEPAAAGGDSVAASAEVGTIAMARGADVDRAETATAIPQADRSPETVADVALLDDGTRQLLDAWPLAVEDGHASLQGGARVAGIEAAFPPGTWGLLASFPAMQEPQYLVLALTQADAPVVTDFVVIAHTATPSEWYVSSVGSGSSVDNIAPGVPGAFVATVVGGGVDLTWGASTADDFQYFNLYRGTTPDFEPGTDNRMLQTVDLAWTDPSPGSGPVYYRLTAVDHAGNEGEAAVASVTVNTGVDETPLAFALHAAAPNPFSMRAAIGFALPRPSAVRLEVYDPAGRVVRTLADGEYPAGRHTVEWNGTDEGGRRLRAGVYLCRLHASGHIASRRVVLIP